MGIIACKIALFAEQILAKNKGKISYFSIFDAFEKHLEG